jgi:chemotaxis protein methyltransferase CheR
VLDEVEDIELQLLLEGIAQRYHYDFRGYSHKSLRRRLAHAKIRFNCQTLSQLQDIVLHDKQKFLELISYLTVQVSEFFRDPAYFLSIRQNVIEHLRTYPSLKVWVAGCGDGEELYSLAILFREEGLENRTLFYATDVSPEAIKRAESGVYDLSRISLFTENHRQAGGKVSLSHYYTAAYGAAVFDRTLRQRTVFSDHSLVSDSVFAEIQLISCRNVLIYFDRELKERAIKLFCDSLPAKGFLGLGSKETLRFSEYADQFTEFDSKHLIYQKNVHASLLTKPN